VGAAVGYAAEQEAASSKASSGISEAVAGGS